MSYSIPSIFPLCWHVGIKASKQLQVFEIKKYDAKLDLILCGAIANTL